MEHLPGPLVALSPSLEPAFYHAQGIGPVHGLPQGARPPPYHHLEGPSQLAYGLRYHKGRHAAEDLLIFVFLPCPGLPAGGVMEREEVLAPELPVLDQVIYYHVGPVADPRAALEEVVEHYEVLAAAHPVAAVVPLVEPEPAREERGPVGYVARPHRRGLFLNPEGLARVADLSEKTQELFPEPGRAYRLRHTPPYLAPDAVRAFPADGVDGRPEQSRGPQLPG